MAIVFAFEKFERGECPGKDICSTDCQPDAFMPMTHFLWIAGAGLYGPNRLVVYLLNPLGSM